MKLFKKPKFETNIIEKNTSFAPVVLVVFNRKDHTQRTVDALKKCPQAINTDLFVFSDGAKDLKNEEKVRELRLYLKTITGFKSVTIFERKSNYGLSTNVIDAVTNVVNIYEEVIVLEDDIVVTPCFLEFMNKNLSVYRNNKNIFQISAKLPFEIETKENDLIFSSTTNCWGWAIWKDRWDLFEKNEEKSFYELMDMDLRKEINVGNLCNVSWQIDSNYNGKRNSWAVYLNYTCAKYKMYSVYPPKSIISNIGQDGSGFHKAISDVCQGTNLNLKKINFIVENIQETLFPYIKDKLTEKEKTIIENYNKKIYPEQKLVEQSDEAENLFNNNIVASDNEKEKSKRKIKREMKKHIKCIKNSTLFDPEWYLLQNPDVKYAKMDPSKHYYLYGWHEGRKASKVFDEHAYLELNPDVKMEGINPLLHYELYGRKEGRRLKQKPAEQRDETKNLSDNNIVASYSREEKSKRKIKREARKHIKCIKNSTLFDPEWYLLQNPDVKYAKMDPSEHYYLYGWHEGRKASKVFDEHAYLELNPDVKMEGINPLLHYELYGRKEGRLLQEDNCKKNKPPEQKDIKKHARQDACVNKLNFDEIYNSFFEVPSLIEFKKEKNPRVSIIIPVYNNYYYTKQCLASIKKNVSNISYEIILADDNSSDETMFIENITKNIKVVKNKKQKGFLQNCNFASKEARGDYIVFLNNDTQVFPNWLEALVETIERDSSIGMVGSKLVYPDNTLQEAGGIVFSNGSGWNYGRGDNPEKLCYNYKREVDYVSGASIIISKSLWKELNGFDENFTPAYYEDTDLAFRVRYLKKLKVVYQPLSVVVHYEGKSNGTDTSSGLKQYQIKNKEKFYNKWKKELSEFHAQSSNDLFLAKDYAKNKKNILVIDWDILRYTRATGSRVTFQYLQFFEQSNFNTKYYPNAWNPVENFLEKHLECGVEVINEDFIEYIKKNGKYFDYIYLNRPNIAPHYIEDIRKYTTAKVLYQCHDLHYLRQYRQRLINKDENAEKLYKTEKETEFKVFNKMDVFCSFSDEEIDIVKKEKPDLCTCQVPLFIFDVNDMNKISYDSNTRKDIIFVAGFGHLPNVDAAKWFVNGVFSSVKKKIPGIKFYIVGSNPTQEVLDLQSKDIVVTGYVSDEKLNEIYSKAKMVVVPLRFGAGVKGKIVEAAYNKVPVITTTIGIEGIPNENNFIDVEDDAELFAKKIIENYNNDELLNKKSEMCKSFIEKNYSPQAVKNSLKKIIKDYDNQISSNIEELSDFPICLAEKEKETLIKYMKKSNNFLEYGAGGSTFLALINSNTKIHSVESSVDWINHLRGWDLIESAEKKKRLTFYHADIGKTGDWGIPLEKTCKEQFPNYSKSVFSKINPKKIDTVFIDGRFRVACALSAIKHVDEKTTIIFHDYIVRERYFVIEEFLEKIEEVNTLVIFKIKKKINYKRVDELYEKYKYDYN